VNNNFTPSSAAPGPLISVIIINFKGKPWLKRCLGSLRNQTIFSQLEVIVSDNASPDQSGRLAAECMQDWPNGRVIQFGRNFGYSEGNNRAAEQANGRYLFFLNNDTWLEPDCLERLMQEVRESGAPAAAPLIMDYMNDTVQSAGGGGFDVFGLMSSQPDPSIQREIFVAIGCSLLIETNLFRKLGGFDDQFFMYADEYDLCWRVWLSGGRVVMAPSARVHHRRAAAVNPKGIEEVLEIRTCDTKRYYATRNNLLVLLKNAQHLLLALIPLQLMLLTIEALAMGALTRRWSHVRRSYGQALCDCWRLRKHIFAERRRLRKFRRRGDIWMLRFLCWRLNRWEELMRMRRFGLPKVDAG
jgi:GT2 family glycosyltransferase